MTGRGDEERVEARIEQRRRAAPRFTDERVTMAHGAGGKASRKLVEGVFVPAFANSALATLGDAGIVDVCGARVAMTTDSFVVTPVRFPGGSIGELAVNGTVNDLAVSGARPLAITASFILEEGVAATVVRAEATAMAAAATAAGVAVVAGDTKVVERGKADQMYVTTTGIGVLDGRAQLNAASVRVGDRVIVSGPIGDHGVAIMLARGGLDIQADVESDTAPVWPAVDALLAACGADVRWMRDATRGGVATVLNELALAAEIGIVLDEHAVPVQPAVGAACELLGIDPLYVANEGRFVVVVAPGALDAALAALRSVTVGKGAAVVGDIVADPPGRVLGRTSFGGHRMIDMLVGDPLPRIC
ncbi:MAG: hydrogenase expression/formation protein HypE [Acidimicrobiia bacterium]|nr:hydrogenase expression/formation protein HypE [Acidimicrobiia bacterium]